jgi:hypothetical protein
MYLASYQRRESPLRIFIKEETIRNHASSEAEEANYY